MTKTLLIIAVLPVVTTLGMVVAAAIGADGVWQGIAAVTAGVTYLQAAFG